MFKIQQVGKLFGTKSYYKVTPYGYTWVKEIKDGDSLKEAEATTILSLIKQNEHTMFFKFNIVPENL